MENEGRETSRGLVRLKRAGFSQRICTSACDRCAAKRQGQEKTVRILLLEMAERMGGLKIDPLAYFKPCALTEIRAPRPAGSACFSPLTTNVLFQSYVVLRLISHFLGNHWFLLVRKEFKSPCRDLKLTLDSHTVD